MRVDRLADTFFHLRALMSGAAHAGLSDAELLQRFVDRRGAVAEAAFDGLIARHGAMVLGVCQRVLRDPHDVDDAFQATFLILVSKARSVRAGASLGPWLYRVARRVAVAAKVHSDRRRAREDRGMALVDIPAPPAVEEGLRGAIDEELDRLPGNFRSVLVLCVLEGLTTEAAAERLRCPVGTVRSRLARGRALIRARLTRRGLASMLVTLDALRPAPAATPTPLVVSTVRVAMLVAAGQPLVAGSVSAGAVTLMRGALRAMSLTNLRAIAGLLLSLAVVGAGITGFAGLVSSGGRDGDEQAKTPGPPTRSQIATPAAAPKPVNAQLLQALQTMIRSVDSVEDEAQKEDFKADALLAIARAQTRLGDANAALATLQKAVQATSGIAGDHAESRRARILVSIAEERMTCGDATAARKTLRQASQQSAEIKDDQPRIDMFSMIARGQVAAGDLASARETLRRTVPFAAAVNRAMLKPSNLGRIAAMQVRADDRTAAAETFRLAFEAARAIDDPRTRAIGLRLVAAWHARTDDFDTALRVAEGIESDEKINALLEIAEIARESGKDEAVVRRVLEQVVPMAKAIKDTPFKAQAQSGIAHRLAKLGDVAGALRVVEWIPRNGPEGAPEDAGTQVEGVAARTLAVIAKTVSAQGDRPGTLRIARAALKEAQTVGNEAERIFALAEAAVALGLGGDQPGARSALQEATQRSALLGEPRRSRLLSRIAWSQAQVGDLDGALRTAGSIAADRPSDKIGALELVSRAQDEAGKKEAARESLRRALLIANAAIDRFPQVQAQGAGAVTIRAKSAAGSKTGLDEETTADLQRLWLLSEAAYLQAQLGEAKAAIATARRLGEDQQAHVIANVAIRFLARGDDLAALSLVSTLDPPDARLRAIQSVGAAIARREGSDKRTNGLGKP